MAARVAVLASGHGSNLRALLDYLAEDDPRPSATVALVASDRAHSGALATARERGLPAAVIDPGAANEAAVGALLRDHGIDCVVLAGYLRLVPADVVRAFRGRIVNVHPALLPSFGGPGMYGERVHRAVIASGARVSGPTVHFVNEQYDQGPIIAQWPVPVYSDDTPQTLAARVLRVEHILLPRVVNALAKGQIELDEHDRVRGVFATWSEEAAFALVPVEDTSLADDIATALDG